MSKIAKVPVVLQMETVECGAASLAMILAHFGKWVPLEKLREDCGVSRDGASARNLISAAKLYGLNGEGYSVSIDTLQDMAPCICHWGFDHFLVFKGFKGNKAYVNDPATGALKIDIEDFSKSFTGVALNFEPTEAFEKGGSKPSMFGYLREQLKGSTDVILITLALGLFGAFVTVATPLFSQIYMDQILSGRNPQWIKWFVAIMLGMALFSAFQVFLTNRYNQRITGSLSLKANSRYINHVLRLPMSFFSQRYLGDIISRLRLNEQVTGTLVNIISPLIINFGLLILYLILMFSYSVPLSIIGIITAILNSIFLALFAEERTNQERALNQSNSKYLSATISCIDNIESIKAAGAERGFFSYWSGLFSHKSGIQSDIDERFSKISIIPEIVSALSNSCVLILGAKLIIDGELTIGMLMAFQGYFNAFMAPVSTILSSARTMIEARSQMERIEDVMKNPIDVRFTGNEMGQGKLKGDIDIEDLSFGYSKSGEAVIKDFNLHLKSGHSVAFVGESGCGKSTLAGLISGLYKPWTGSILYDGKPIESINADEFTNSVSVINQNVVLFEDTVAQNVRMWDSSIEDFAVVMACENAELRRDILLRHDGFSTKIVKGGANFSGGQRQRIEIATALCREPSIIIMDEATSALDPTTEKNVMQKIKDSGSTLIIIAHRLSTIRDCDEIIVLDKGKIAQRGTHTSLMASEDGLYYKLMQNT